MMTEASHLEVDKSSDETAHGNLHLAGTDKDDATVSGCTGCSKEEYCLCYGHPSKCSCSAMMTEASHLEVDKSSDETAHGNLHLAGTDKDDATVSGCTGCSKEEYCMCYGYPSKCSCSAMMMEASHLEARRLEE